MLKLYCIFQDLFFQLPLGKSSTEICLYHHGVLLHILDVTPQFPYLDGNKVTHSFQP